MSDTNGGGQETARADHRATQLYEREYAWRIETLRRVRNMLALVRAVARRTALMNTNVHEYWSHLDGRLDALARLQSFAQPDAEASLALLISEELAAQGGREGETFDLDGADVSLPYRQAATLGMAFHELAVNSVKFGTLSGRGKISVSWRLDDGLLSLEWNDASEGDTPPEQRRGFGKEWLTQTLPYEADAQVSWDLSKAGLNCKIQLRLD